MADGPTREEEVFTLEVLDKIMEKLKSSPAIVPVPCQVCGRGFYLLRVSGGYMQPGDADFSPPTCEECRGE